MKVKRKYNPLGCTEWPATVGRTFPYILDKKGAGGTRFHADWDGNHGPHRSKIPGPKQPPEPKMVLINGKLRRSRGKERKGGDATPERFLHG